MWLSRDLISANLSKSPYLPKSVIVVIPAKAGTQ
jgi:hypothetical protein